MHRTSRARNSGAPPVRTAVVAAESPERFGSLVRDARAYDVADLRRQLSAAIKQFDEQAALREQFGAAMRPDLAVKHGRLAADAAARAADLADRITAADLGGRQ